MALDVFGTTPDTRSQVSVYFDFVPLTSSRTETRPPYPRHRLWIVQWSNADAKLQLTTTDRDRRWQHKNRKRGRSH